MNEDVENSLEDFEKEASTLLVDSMVADMRLLQAYGYPQTELVNLLARDLESSKAAIQVLLAMAGYKPEF